MVENQYYLCGLHNATLVEKLPGRWNFNVDKTNKEWTARKILFTKYFCEVLSFLEQNIDDVEYFYCLLLRMMKKRGIALLIHQSPKGIYIVQKVNRKNKWYSLEWGKLNIHSWRSRKCTLQHIILWEKWSIKLQKHKKSHGRQNTCQSCIRTLGICRIVHRVQNFQRKEM